jgi:hypothetical protein
MRNFIHKQGKPKNCPRVGTTFTNTIMKELTKSELTGINGGGPLTLRLLTGKVASLDRQNGLQVLPDGLALDLSAPLQEVLGSNILGGGLLNGNLLGGGSSGLLGGLLRGL